MNEVSVKTGAEISERLNEAARLLRGMAEMVRATNERMAALETQVRMLEKVTPQQAAEINRAARRRATEICAEYRAGGCEKAAAAAIRRDVRLMTGARCARDIARCDYKVVLEAVGTWDDYGAMKAIRRRGAKE